MFIQLRKVKKSMTTNSTIIEGMKAQPKRVKARIKEFNSGQYGRGGEYIAVIQPEYFKNGRYKKQSFKVIEKIETIKKGYGYGNCKHAETIAEIIEIL